jgi:hypothetical protein
MLVDQAGALSVEAFAQVEHGLYMLLGYHRPCETLASRAKSA